MTEDHSPVRLPPPTSVDVSDVRALRALAHPLRGQLLGLLRLEGPATATGLAARVGESSGTTSYHLRELARWGFVEEAQELGNGRERWWRARHRGTRFDNAELAEAPGGPEIVLELAHRQVAHQRRVLAVHAERRGELSPEWQAATSLNDWVLRLTPQQTRDLAAELSAVLERYRAEEPEDEDLPVLTVLLDLFPLQETTL